MATTASTRVRSWLHGVLQSVGPKVFPDKVRADYLARAIVYRPVANTDLVDVGHNTFMVRSLFDVFVSDRASGSYAHDLQADADELDAAILSGPMVEVNGRYIEAVQRVAEIDDTVSDEGVEYRRLGGSYLILSTIA